MGRRFSVRTAMGVLAVLAVASGHGRAQGHSAVEAQVRQQIESFAAAYGANDLDQYFSNYADDMTWWGPNGNRNEAGGLTPKRNYQSSYPESVKKTGGLAGSKVSDLRVQVSPSGDAAIASYRLDVVRKNPTPDRPPSAYPVV